ncbi:MAG: DUF1697 domain-containing protein [Clostridiales bacterium]|nr:DUF1697 domain-containing protein [Clostridiales bacterium]
MIVYIALLRGINVGGNNKIIMSELKSAFERRGFQKAVTYINSGNILFGSELDESAVKTVCEELIAGDFALDIPVCVISADDLAEALANAPEWWNKASGSRHDAFFVIPPLTAEGICDHVRVVNEEYEKVYYYGKVIFWSAPIAAFSRTRWSKISKDKAMYRGITVRSANTAIKLAEMAQKYIQ